MDNSLNIRGLLFILVCFTPFIAKAQVDFLDGPEWHEVKELSAHTGRPIFIDFYTTWCGPCKKMDRTTFMDPTVSEVLNEQFVCLKLNAEADINEDLVQLYRIKSYPTFVFVNQNGELIYKESGYRSAEELRSICENILSFLEEDIDSKLTESNIDELSDGDLEAIIIKYPNFRFRTYQAIKNKYYNQLRLGNRISLFGVDFLFDNYDWKDEYSLLTSMIPKKIPLIDDFGWKRKFVSLYNDIFKNVIDLKNESEFDQYAFHFLRMHEKLSIATKNQMTGDPNKEIKSKKLAFFENNGYQEKYFLLADTLINEYILPLNISSVQRRDEFEWNISKWDKSQNKSEILEDTTDIKKIELTMSDSLYLKNPISAKISHRLNNISENIVQKSPQDQKLIKALSWVNKSLEYLELPETRIIKAAILKKLKRDKESNVELGIAKQSILFDKLCERKISEFDL